ncbi:MAG: hypothetical protein HC837_10890 [Chloroflexaceae bacterium]|nr:hypothetical protein [Chloroflexaceae bacterium]
MSIIRDPKRFIATVIAGVAGLLVLLDAAGNVPAIAALAFLLVDWTATLIALALLIGVLSIAGAHGQRVLRRDGDWTYSIVLLVGMVAVIAIGVIGIPGMGPFPFPQSLVEEPIRLFFETVYQPLASSLLGLLVFFSLSAALRSLQRGTTEALVIMGVALLVLLIQLPVVATVPILGDVMLWINDYIVLAGARGLLIGASVGTLVACMRLLLGFDQPYLDR